MYNATIHYAIKLASVGSGYETSWWGVNMVRKRGRSLGGGGGGGGGGGVCLERMFLFRGVNVAVA